MSNRRLFKRRGPQGKQRDAEGAFVDGPEPALSRSWSQRLVVAAKVAFGAALLAGCVLALSFFAYNYAQTTPRFAIRSIEVSGAERLVRKDVILSAGLAKGQNLFALDLESATRRILENPWISRAQITRHLPDTVRIEIHERKAAAVAIVEGFPYLVSSEAELFDKALGGQPHDLPVVTGLSLAALEQDRSAQLSRLSDALYLLRDYEQLELSRSQPAQEVHLLTSGEVVLIVGEGGISLHLGTGPYKKKLLRLSRVMKQAKRSGGNPSVIFLDNRAHPERVVVRLQ